MQTISTEYLKLNAKLHETDPEYGCRGGEKWGGIVSDTANSIDAIDILDYGAGKQSLAKCLAVFDVTSYDPAIRELSVRPSPHNVVACLDVLEHVEPELIDNVLADIQMLMKQVGVLVINTKKAGKVLADGRNAHLLQRDHQWWLTKLMRYFEIHQFNNFGRDILIIVGKREEK